MRRRHLLKSLATAPLAVTLPAALTHAQRSEPQDSFAKPEPRKELAPENLQFSSADGVSEGRVTFFSQAQFAALERLCELIYPPFDGMPGAREAGVPEFLDALIGESPEDQRQLSSSALDRLNAEAERIHGKQFSELSVAQIAPMLEPLTQPWSYGGPEDNFARFLSEIKAHVIRATENSQQWISAMAARNPEVDPVGTYWLPFD